MISRLGKVRIIASVIVLVLCCSLCSFTGIAGAAEALDYGDRDNWAYCGQEGNVAQDTDVFFICPTIFMGTANDFNMSIKAADSRKKFLGATNMEKGIYDTKSNFYAPYYRQAGLNVYTLSTTQADPYFALAYGDVKTAFEYYLHNYNQGRPFILAGFSQGADMIVRLLKDEFADPQLQEQLVAAYVVGWRVTQDEINDYAQLKMAQGEFDTGVIISFNSESPETTWSALVPGRSLAINPLNWHTDSTPAGKELNKGAVFPDYDGKIKQEIKQLTGAFLDPQRGTLKVTDISSDEYPPVLEVFAPGVYHVYDYQFFYRNLQDNVRDRIDAYQQSRGLKPAA